MELDELLASLAAVRWEQPDGEVLARNLAAVLRAQVGAVVVEVALGPGAAWRVDESGTATEVDVDAVERGHARRPRAGWGGGRLDRIGHANAATQWHAIPLPTRHTTAHLVVWSRRGHRPDPLADDALRTVVALLVDAHVLVQKVAHLSRHAHADVRRLRDELYRARPQATRRSAAMRATLERADAVAPFDTPVLITGPSGSGKEVMARRIHGRSRRSGSAFVKVNCGALPQGLVDSALFGHARGAFTGATDRHRGVFERAAAGTLLLDEVAELPPATQVKLLRVLQHGTFTPLGSEAELHSDARVIAATHRDLPALVAAGSFREDLFYRLAVFEVAVPGLRERTEDLAGLVAELVERVATRMGRSVPRVPPAVMAELSARAWPGNVRQLENVIEAALVMSPASTLNLATEVATPRDVGERRSEVRPLNASIKSCIEAALAVSGGRIYGEGGAAQRLGLKPGTLQSKMRKLGIRRRDFVTG